MKIYLALIKKEFLALTRSYKLFILLMIFLTLGFLNPISAKYLPELMKAMVPGVIELPESTVIDSWTQFFKNMTQTGLLVVIIIFSNILSLELQKGTLINFLTKGLSRSTILITKFITMSLTWTLCLYLTFIVTYLYNHLLFKDMIINNLFLSVSGVWLFGLLMFSFILLGSVLSKNNIGGLMLAGMSYLVMMLLSIFENISKYLPVQLVNENLALVNQTISCSSFIKIELITIGLIIIINLLTIQCFKSSRL